MHVEKYTALLLSALVLLSCQPEIDAPEQALGDIDPSRFVSIGTNGTAGYADDALHINGQTHSFVNILAQQFDAVQATSFIQPVLGIESVGINIGDDSRLILGNKTDCKGVTSLSPIREASQGDISALSTPVYGAQGPFNNLGVPNSSILDINTSGYGNPANGTGNFNPYYARTTSDQANASILQDAIDQNPTFYSLMLGDADIMAYATSGGTANPIPPSSGAAGVGFNGSLNEIISALNVNGAKGVISNIPTVLSFPYFTTIPYNGLTLDAENAATLNTVFNPLGISFVEGDNPFTVSDPSEPFNVRKMVEGELILLSIPLDSVKCNGMGSIVPIPDKYVLSLAEIDEINSKIDAYNEIILTTSQTSGLAFVDTKRLYASLNAGIIYNGVSMDANFVTGGFFSLDGRNLSPIGQALLANDFIKAINSKFNSKIPYTNVTKYPGIVFP
ncbi:MAG: hypothetical protein JKY09_00590 [Crocinitomicaceae bacterium]|nr:hypothetical protein [Crocinitomicaceae bacterium]